MPILFKFNRHSTRTPHRIDCARLVKRMVKTNHGVELTTKEVEHVLVYYHEVIADILASGKSFRIPGVCVLTARPDTVSRIDVSVSTKYTEKRRTYMNNEKSGMEKYGVNTTEKTEDGVKLSSEKPKHCPICQEALLERGGQIVCPKHGTAPFER